MAKNVSKGSLAARAWSEVKGENDPEFDVIPNQGLKNDLEFAAERVKDTGVAATDFEKKVLELVEADGKDEAKSTTAKSTGTKAKSTTKTKSKQTAAQKKKAKAAQKLREDAAKAGEKTDQSGHVATAKEKAAATKAEKDAPLHP